ncbi:MAG: hypothetical protein WAK18_00620 [Nocardioidaceae bacterium]
MNFSPGASSPASVSSGSLTPAVHSVHASPLHSVTKPACAEISLVAGWGVSGDAHAGTTVQHLSRVRRDPTQPNLRQVHLIQRELFVELADSGFLIAPGAMGENLVTERIDLLSLARRTRAGC